jgi:hypothetical protein
MDFHRTVVILACKVPVAWTAVCQCRTQLSCCFACCCGKAQCSPRKWKEAVTAVILHLQSPGFKLLAWRAAVVTEIFLFFPQLFQIQIIIALSDMMNLLLVWSQ